eukprot:660095-Pelagomonas_calceolata.AAC.5
MAAVAGVSPGAREPPKKGPIALAGCDGGPLSKGVCFAANGAGTLDDVAQETSDPPLAKQSRQSGLSKLWLVVLSI